MKSLFALLNRLLHNVLNTNRSASEEVPVAIDAYCAECGGMTLISDRVKLRIYCPQCHQH